MARPAGSPNKDKPFREALRMEALLAEREEETPAKKGSLRYIARQLLIRAGEETAAAREVGDRLDGKPAQAIIGGDEDDPELKIITRIERVIVDAKGEDSA
jgi:hypothetical protein